MRWTTLRTPSPRLAAMLFSALLIGSAAVAVSATPASAATANICISSKVVDTGSNIFERKSKQTVKNGCAKQFRVQVLYEVNYGGTWSQAWTKCKTLAAVGTLTYYWSYNPWTGNGTLPKGKWRTC